MHSSACRESATAEAEPSSRPARRCAADGSGITTSDAAASTAPGTALPSPGRYVLVRSTKPAGHNLTWLAIVPAVALALLCGPLITVRIRRGQSVGGDSGPSLLDDVKRFAAMARTTVPNEAERLLAAAEAPEPDLAAIKQLVRQAVSALEASDLQSLNRNVALTLSRDVTRRLDRS